MLDRRHSGDPVEWLLEQVARLIRFLLPGLTGRLLAGFVLGAALVSLALWGVIRWTTWLARFWP